MQRYMGATLVFLMSLATAAAAQPNRVKAYVAHSGKDPVGKQLAFFIKEEIRGSPTFTEAVKYSDGGMQLNLITLDPDDQSGKRTIYSATITIYNEDGFDYFVTSFVGYCGAHKLRECAADLYADMGTQLEDIKKALLKSAN